ncbi:hypothetical protein AAHA92_03965 [Salvia divinorum]|uniref:UspA domain-containing protein n=1 Tax=Salvia divinorum TaxID=28513 RepID=A0ABD1I1P5_SALDI
MATSDSYLRHLSSGGYQIWESESKRWGGQAEGFGGGGGENGVFAIAMKKRVMVVVDQSSHTKHAMMWALNHVADKGDILTLLHVVSDTYSLSSSHYLAASLGSLCKACKPEVEVEALVIQGPKMDTVISQVKKLEVSVLVLGQKKQPSPFLNCLCMKSSSEAFVDECINNLECLAIGVRKQSKAVGGYLITTRWHKNFWLLA